MLLMADKKNDGKKSPNRTGTSLHVYIDPDLRSALKRFIDAQRLKSSITDVVELALGQFLEQEGFWLPKDADGSDD